MSLIIAVFAAIASLIAGNLLWFNLSNDGLLLAIVGLVGYIACLLVCLLFSMAAVSLAQHNRLSK
jgi:hypothetical protein